MNQASMAAMGPQRRAYFVLIILFLGLSPKPAGAKASAGVELVVASGTPVKANAHKARSDSVLACTACQLRTMYAWSLHFEVSDHFDLLYVPRTLGWIDLGVHCAACLWYLRSCQLHRCQVKQGLVRITSLSTIGWASKSLPLLQLVPSNSWQSLGQCRNISAATPQQQM